jgi:hypothetical protein
MQSIPVTAVGGAATVYSDIVRGAIHRIEYVKTDFANGVTLVVTTERTGQAVLSIAANAMNASTVYHPRNAASKVADGVAVTVFDIPVFALTERLKFVFADAGVDTKLGTIKLFTEG